MSTHQLREALELATHVALIDRGQLAFSGERTQEMLDDPGWLYRTLRRELMRLRTCSVVTIAAKDLRSRVAHQRIASTRRFAFALVILLLFSFAFDPIARRPRDDLGRTVVAGLCLCRRLVLNRSFARELPNDCLDALISSRRSGVAHCSSAKHWRISCCC